MSVSSSTLFNSGSESVKVCEFGPDLVLITTVKEELTQGKAKVHRPSLSGVTQIR